MILLVGFAAAYALQSQFVGRSTLWYVLALMAIGALAALQFHRGGLVAAVASGALGAAAFACLAAICLPVPGIRMALHPEPSQMLVLSLISSLAGALVGLIYGVVALCLVRQPAGQVRFSLRGLLLAVTALAMLFAFVAWRLRQFDRERQLHETWSAAGVSLTFDYWGQPKAAWVLPAASFDDAALARLADLRELRALGLAGSNVTAAGMPNLQKLTRLRHLNVGGLPITDAGIAELSAMSSLKYVDLFATQVTPAGMAAFVAARPQTNIRTDSRLIRRLADLDPTRKAPPTLSSHSAEFPY